MATYQIDYIGLDSQETSIQFVGDMVGLSKEITWIEERGGWGVSVTGEEGETVYADGGFVPYCGA